MSSEPLTQEEQALADTFLQFCQEYKEGKHKPRDPEEEDPLEIIDWDDMAVGWFLAKGADLDTAHKLSYTLKW